MSPALQRCQRLLEYIQLVVESRQLRLKRLHRQPLGMELLDQDLELGDERRRQLCELLKGLQQPVHGRRDRLRQCPQSPASHRPDEVGHGAGRATNSSIADCSKPFRCVSPSSAIATALVRHPFGPDPIIRPGRRLGPHATTILGFEGKRQPGIAGTRCWATDAAEPRRTPSDDGSTLPAGRHRP